MLLILVVAQGRVVLSVRLPQGGMFSVKRHRTERPHCPGCSLGSSGFLSQNFFLVS